MSSEVSGVTIPVVCLGGVLFRGLMPMLLAVVQLIS